MYITGCLKAVKISLTDFQQNFPNLSIPLPTHHSRGQFCVQFLSLYSHDHDFVLIQLHYLKELEITSLVFLNRKKERNLNKKYFKSEETLCTKYQYRNTL